MVRRKSVEYSIVHLSNTNHIVHIPVHFTCPLISISPFIHFSHIGSLILTITTTHPLQPHPSLHNRLPPHTHTFSQQPPSLLIRNKVASSLSSSYTSSAVFISTGRVLFGGGPVCRDIYTTTYSLSSPLLSLPPLPSPPLLLPLAQKAKLPLSLADQRKTVVWDDEV